MCHISTYIAFIQEPRMVAVSYNVFTKGGFEKKMERENFASESPWEQMVGFSRAVRTGNLFYFAGTLDTDNYGHPVGKNAYEQACNIFEKLKSFIEKSGGTLDNIVRTRMYIVNLNDAEEVSKAHAEYFQNIKPTATMIQVANLLGEGFLVEIEAEGVF